jgi:hypothetical protein
MNLALMAENSSLKAFKKAGFVLQKTVQLENEKFRRHVVVLWRG